MAESPNLAQQLQEAREEPSSLLNSSIWCRKNEHYFLAHREAEAKLQRYQQEQQRAEALIEALLARLSAGCLTQVLSRQR